MTHPSGNFETDFSQPQLFSHLQSLPYFRALLRAVEASYYQKFELESPVLDVGTGDGHFASLAFTKKIDVGVDPWGALMAEARYHGAYSSLVVADGGALPFPQGHFASALSNSVLEHVLPLDTVLAEIGRVLRSGALFLFSVPNHQWTRGLSMPPNLRKVGLSGWARAYEQWFIRNTRHYHMLSPEEWEERLRPAGFTLLDWWHYFSPAALAVLEWGHYLGLPSLVARKLTGRWILVPHKWNLGLLEEWLQPYASNARTDHGTYSFFVAQRL